ncbi:hypothetical protein ACUXJP_000493 [Staphylococcus cohnii]
METSTLISKNDMPRHVNEIVETIFNEKSNFYNIQ